MSKVINNPAECGYRAGDKRCNHRNRPDGDKWCNWDKEFPINCPLQDCLYPRSLKKRRTDERG
jgi:hypothetical protein